MSRDATRRPRRQRSWSAVAVVALILLVCACENPERVITYAVASRGPVVTDLEDFADEVAEVLGDPRGWRLGGAVQFRRVQGPADFTVWLATAEELPRFSSKCSTLWSCRVGPDVVINENRWRLATPAWIFQVPRYRAYVINHEVGHWLGLGHAPCEGVVGRPAPVMAQQSKGLEGTGVCSLNAWPHSAEIAAVAAELGVSPRAPVLASTERPVGRLEAVDDRGTAGGTTAGSRRLRVQGWALDGDTTAAIDVSVVADGVRVTTITADLPRPDIVGLFALYGDRHGFDAEVDVPAGTSMVCVNALGIGAGPPLGFLGCSELP